MMISAVMTAVLTAALSPLSTFAATPDLSISASSIHFNQSVLRAGERLRIYSTIRNEGEVDVAAQVFFYQGDQLIGTSQVVSVVAGGSGDDIYVDYIIPQTAFNLRAVIQGQDPVDVNPANDVAVTPLFTPVVDFDRDGVADASDNCADAPNSDQLDTDSDGEGNACDSDDDNDGISDTAEGSNGTSPSNSDTDGDGSPDGSDAFPLDSNRSTNPPPTAVAIAPTTPPPAPKPVTSNQQPATNPTPSNPAPVVAGTTDEGTGAEPTEGSANDDGVTRLADSSSASSTSSTIDNSAVPTLLTLDDLKLSPDARFTYKQIDWRTYEFDAKPQGQVSGAFAWDFGDGSTSIEGKVTHIFPRSGDYKVTLAVATDDGKMYTDTEVLSISFFHLSNPLVMLSLLLLILILLALIIFLYRLRREKL